MQSSVKKLYLSFNGKLVGHRKMKRKVCEVLSKMPEEIINYITKNCWFFGSMEDAWAFTFAGNDLKNQHLIFLSDILFFQSDDKIEKTIAHEIGHVMLGHRNAVFEKQTKAEVKKQEKQARNFVKKFFLKK